MSEVEPWLRGTRTNLDAIPRQIIHAIDLASEDAHRWCGALSEEQLNARPFGLAPVAFHLRHIARSLDRLLTYAEGGALTPAQLDQLASELQPIAHATDLWCEFDAAIVAATARVLAFAPETYPHPRTVGRKRLPTTVGSLLIHCAEHTQRHIGQAITTAKVVAPQQPSE